MYDLYEVAVVTYTLFRLDLDYQLLRHRLIDSVQEMYQQMNSYLSANQIIQVTVAVKAVFDMDKDDNHNLVIFMMEQFLQKDSVSYNHDIYDYETIETEQRSQGSLFPSRGEEQVRGSPPVEQHHPVHVGGV